jgi:hypothetical protein
VLTCAQKLPLETAAATTESLASKNFLVAGAGFEPAVPQTRDYEPNRDKANHFIKSIASFLSF